MSLLIAAKQRVEMAPARTLLEQVHGNNIARRTMMANHPFHDEVFLGKTNGRLNPVPEEFQQAVWTGTAAFIGDKGRKLEKIVETYYEYKGKIKLVRFETNEEQQAAKPDTVFMCNHGFSKTGSLYLPFYNARTSKPVITDEEMQEADVVNMKFDGTISKIEVRSRDGGAFEKIENEHSLSWFSDKAVLGLLWRDYYVLDGKDVYLDENPPDLLQVALDAAVQLLGQLE